MAELRPRDVYGQVGDVFARPQILEVAVRFDRRRSFDIHIAIDVFRLPHFEIRGGEIASAGDVSLAVDNDEFLMHPLEEPKRMMQRHRMIDANLHALGAQLREYRFRDVKKIRIDDEPHTGHASPARLAQQSESRERHAIVPR